LPPAYCGLGECSVVPGNGSFWVDAFVASKEVLQAGHIITRATELKGAPYLRACAGVHFLYSGLLCKTRNTLSAGWDNGAGASRSLPTELRLKLLYLEKQCLYLSL
jgi:hypothetical protein